MATTQPVTISPLEQPLTYKTWVLKVSIHCEGCKRKVKKVLHSIEGVYIVNVDTKQQKAIVTGNVEAETLIKKLVKSGKHAEMWPETPDQQRDKSKKSKKKDNKDKDKDKDKDKNKDTDSESSTEESTGGAGAGSHGGPNSQKQAVKFEVVHGGAPAKTSEGGGGTVRFSDGGATIGGGVAAETRSEGKKPETGASGNHPPLAEKNVSESDGGAVKSSGGSGTGTGGGGKKKKKKGHHRSATEGGPSSGGAPASTGSGNQIAGTPAGNHSPPRHQVHQYPPPTTTGPLHYHTPPQPVYVTSYNTAHPTSSYTASYYASPPGYSYAHTYQGPEMEPSPFDLDYHPRQPLDSFELFSDENPNGCSVM
ncbi:Heavy metal-associated isoprenylated plant protein 35 [Camellia lanceoleosa]|uniref:Heavy metal-associated isoprenylated plant protein 35 n=1 Tax=Camellia lanceoleosa TaxID=1840588 RepID=A0ACC0I8W6_9ERIC|nr:Heavy metal-associated isoprenylated plant protein 35 [Camellia lanceoleosa]